MEKLSIRKLQALRKNWLNIEKQEIKAFEEYVEYLYSGIEIGNEKFTKFYEEHKIEWQPEEKSDIWS